MSDKQHKPDHQIRLGDLAINIWCTFSDEHAGYTSVELRRIKYPVEGKAKLGPLPKLIREDDIPILIALLQGAKAWSDYTDYNC